MKIADVDLHIVQIPRGTPAPPVRSLLVRLTSDSGAEGWGEAGVDWRPADLTPRRNALLPVLEGASLFNVAEVACSEALATPELRAAMEMAHWDLLGKTLEQPLSHLWGGVYRQRIPLIVRLPALPVSALPAVARELADCGYHAQLLSATGDLETDQAMIAGVREALGSRGEIRFDARQRYRFDDARKLARELARHQTAMLIDPLTARETEHLPRFARQCEVPVAVGNSLSSTADVLRVVREEGVRCVVLASEPLGGLSATRNAVAIADAGGLTVSLGGRATLGLGTAARLQLAAAIPRLAIANECFTHDLQDDILTAPLAPVDGLLAVSGEPGIGVTVDRQRLERWLVD